MPQSFSSLHCHVIFSTKDRAPSLVESLRDRLYSYIGGIVTSEGCALLAAGGVADHVRLLVSISRETSIAELVRQIKGSSSKWVNENFPELRRFAWQAGYGAFTVSYSHISRVKSYIATQAEHHRTMTFQEEYLVFLRRHHIPFDERYLWD
jgi:REP element-mobilizing transposase RayT